MFNRSLADGNRTITVAVRDDREVVAVWPGLRDRALGVAIDVGSTTIAGHLCDLATGEALATAGTMNPQIRFGEDLMSRVSYVMMNPGGEAELTSAVRGALDDLVGDLVGQVDAERDEVRESWYWWAIRLCTTYSWATTPRRWAGRRSPWPSIRPSTWRPTT
ncbi:MAG: hypothetical protein CM1200mP26_04940 [Acidimicrobiales bacterium]|nr:MAG: hypothetical protein CM1200mP26_04940 [Acidimicrobiales bacterium]